MILKKNLSPVLLILALFAAACGSSADEIARRSAEAGQHSAAAAGAAQPDGTAVFRKYCVACHGADGKLGFNGAHDLSQSALTLEERIAQITKGKNLMTPFGEILSPEEIRAVAEYTMTFK